MRMFFDFKIVENVIVRRSLMGKFFVVVCAVLALEFRAVEFGKREAVCPSSPMPRMHKSKVFNSVSYFFKASFIVNEISKW